VSGYMLAFAAGLIVAGNLGDRLGRKLIFLLGVGFFGLASLCAGLSASGPELIAARVVQGAAAAAMAPQVLATFRAIFAAGERGKAFGIYGAMQNERRAVDLSSLAAVVPVGIRNRSPRFWQSHGESWGEDGADQSSQKRYRLRRLRAIRRLRELTPACTAASGTPRPRDGRLPARFVRSGHLLGDSVGRLAQRKLCSAFAGDQRCFMRDVRRSRTQCAPSAVGASPGIPRLSR